jgi:hypothetical protein
MHIAGLRALRHMRRHWRAGRYAPARHQLVQAMRCFLAMAMPTLSYRRGSKSRRPGGRTPVTIGPASPAGH